VAPLTVVRKVLLEEVSIERAWELLTDPVQVRKWYAFGGAEIDLVPGGVLTFRWVEHGMYRGAIDVVEAPTRFAYRFSQLEDADPASDNATEVELTLEETEAGTLVKVSERGFEQLALHSPTAGKELAVASAEAWLAAFAELHALAHS